ncbi:conserved hypothetical protein [Ricinus communis]|uniref:Secreted protein n=1 Tax=Ricinus communis TaxID=3988 RepID=B9R719_RICCO|nr:conserved hypothetical protein [Ricinus communis]
MCIDCYWLRRLLVLVAVRLLAVSVLKSAGSTGVSSCCYASTAGCVDCWVCWLLRAPVVERASSLLLTACVCCLAA